MPAIISKLLSLLETNDERIDVIIKIHARLSQLPNTGHLEIWLQRISHSFKPNLGYREPLCQLVEGKATTVWNNSWITSAKLRAVLDPATIVDRRKVRSIKPVMSPKEIAIFGYEWY